ncbi:TRAP transporter large permease subunit, partial [Woeseiaceae bacterium]|nr:TRAP transporter large permease subunit [Woeseiaceae bacterium]
FLTVAFFVRIEARRLQIPVDMDDRAPSIVDSLKSGWYFIVPLAVLIASLIIGYTPVRSATFAIIAVIIVSWMTSIPMTMERCIDAILDALRIMVPTVILLVAIGLVVNVVTTTGLGNVFSMMIVDWAGGSLLFTLVLIALASLILGMGLPVIASYIVLATLAAPALYDLISQPVMLDALQAANLPANVQAIIELFDGDPVRALAEMPVEMRQLVRGELLDPALITGMMLSAHLIIFWLSQDSNVTPPICLAAFTAAAIAGTRPMRTGLTSWKIAKGLYLVPVLFAFTPLITGSWSERLSVFVFACFGLYALAGILQWHLESRLNAGTAVLLLAITNAPAPIIGGIICPPVEAAVSTPAANLGENPDRIIMGMVIMPVETVVVIAEPDIEPIKPEPTTATCPAPPWKRPAILFAILTMNSPTPDLSRKEPNKINMNTNVDEMFATIPNIPFSLQ